MSTNSILTHITNARINKFSDVPHRDDQLPKGTKVYTRTERNDVGAINAYLVLRTPIGTGSVDITTILLGTFDSIDKADAIIALVTP